MSDIKDILAKITPVKAEARICLDGDLYLQRDRVRERLDALDGWEASALSDTDPRVHLRDELAAIEQRMRDAQVTFVFTAIGDRASSDLLAAHPSPKDDKGADKYAWNPQTYPVALVAAACVDPKMTVADVEALFDRCNLDQRNTLFGAAFAANNRSLDVPFLLPASEPAGSTDSN